MIVVVSIIACIAWCTIAIMIDICGIRKALEKIANKIERR